MEALLTRLAVPLPILAVGLAGFLGTAVIRVLVVLGWGVSEQGSAILECVSAEDGTL